MEQKSTTGFENQDTVRAKPHWWAAWCWAIGGVFLNWTSAFNRFSGNYPPYSAHVLLRMAVTATLGALISLIVVRVVRKLNRRDVGVVFFLASSLSYVFSYIRV
jgi:ABC-type Fe3+-siderophore transport system permease subunit